MHLKSVIFFLVFAFFGCNDSYAKQKVNPESFVKIYKHILIEECVENTKCVVGQFVMSGSGIAIHTMNSGTVILSAAHVCELDFNKKFAKNLKKFKIWLEVESHLNKRHKALLIDGTFNPGDVRDLCSIFVPELKLKSVNIAKKAPVPGEEVMAMSAIAGVYHPPSVPMFKGIYSGLLPDKLNAMTTIHAMGGSSGSGVLNSRGELVGILFAVNSKVNHISLVSSWEQTALFAAQTLKKISDILRKGDTSKQ